MNEHNETSNRKTALQDLMRFIDTIDASIKGLHNRFQQDLEMLDAIGGLNDKTRDMLESLLSDMDSERKP